MNNQPDIRLVAIDLDGTLLNDAKEVSDPTAAALSALPAMDVRVVIASARPPRSVRHIYTKLGLDAWQINYNGAMIWDEAAQKSVFHEPIEPVLARRIVAYARTLFPRILVSCEVQDRWLTDRIEHLHLTETGKLFQPDLVAPIATICAEPVTKILLLGPPETISRLAPILAETQPEVCIVRSDPDLIQVMNRNVSKGTALIAVAEHYGVAMKNVMAIGDAANDIPMLQVAGIGIAMDNAVSQVKAVAGWTAPSNNAHGVYAALYRYGLCR